MVKPTVAIVTDSASDIPPDAAKKLGIAIVPVIVSFGSESFKVNEELSMDEFWARLTAPGAPFPKTAAPPPAAFTAAYDRAFAGGAQEILSVHVASKLSATYRNAEIAAADHPQSKNIHLVDTATASAAEGLLVARAYHRAQEGWNAPQIVAELGELIPKTHVIFFLDTLDYLKAGGRISPARAAIGGLLSVKPIIDIVDGEVITVDRPRTTAKARERLFEIIGSAPVQELTVLHSESPAIEDFRDELCARLPAIAALKPGFVRAGAAIGPHTGPNGLGVALIRA
jgi:DegV family protein with EDD domain